MSTPPVLASHTFTKGNLVYAIERVEDPTPDLSFLAQNYACQPNCGHRRHNSAHVGPRTNARHQARDRARLTAYERGDWCMVGVVCKIAAETATRWAMPTMIARASIWNVESDSDESYFGDL